MEPEWLTYAEVADRLGIAPEAARSRAKRSGWRRQAGNDGRARVLVALEPRPPDDRPATARTPTGRKVDNAATVKALESHVETLKEQLGIERAKAERAIAEYAALAERLASLVEDLARRPWWRRLTG